MNEAISKIRAILEDETPHLLDKAQRIHDYIALLPTAQAPVVPIHVIADIIRKSDKAQDLLIENDEDELSGDKAYWAARAIHAHLITLTRQQPSGVPTEPLPKDYDFGFRQKYADYPASEFLFNIERNAGGELKNHHRSQALGFYVGWMTALTLGHREESDCVEAKLRKEIEQKDRIIQVLSMPSEGQGLRIPRLGIYEVEAKGKVFYCPHCGVDAFCTNPDCESNVFEQRNGLSQAEIDALLSTIQATPPPSNSVREAVEAMTVHARNGDWEKFDSDYEKALAALYAEVGK